MEGDKLNHHYHKTFPMNKLFNALDWSGVGAAILAFTTSFFAPIAIFLVLILAFCSADLITGINAAKVRGEPIRSFGIRRTLSKILMYWILILCSQALVLTSEYMIESYGFNSISLSFLTQYVVILVAYAEYQSIVENVEKSTGVKIWVAIKQFFRVDKKK